MVPLVPLRFLVPLPDQGLPLVLRRSGSRSAVEAARERGGEVVLAVQRDPRQLVPDRAGLYDHAATARLEGMLVRPDALHVVAVPQRRVRLGAVEQRGRATWCEATP